MTGRPSRLTPELQKAIALAIKGGNTLHAACWSNGIDPQLARDWIRQGEGRHPTRKKSKRFADFAEAIKKARADAQVERILRIRKAAQGGTVASRRTITRKGGDVEVTETFTLPQWQADAWHLERSDPDHWALRDRKELADLKRQVQELEKSLGQLPRPSP